MNPGYVLLENARLTLVRNCMYSECAKKPKPFPSPVAHTASAYRRTECALRHKIEVVNSYNHFFIFSVHTVTENELLLEIKHGLFIREHITSQRCSSILSC